jgi:hypothetical protein
MDWRTYFTIEVVDSHPDELLIEKANPYRDELGRFASADSGGPKNTPQRTNLMKIRKPLKDLRGPELQTIVKNAIASNKGRENISMSKLMYNVTQLTGYHPGSELAGAIAKTLHEMDKRGLIKVSSKEMPVTDKHGNFVMKKPKDDADLTGHMNKDFMENVLKRQEVSVKLTSMQGAKAYAIKHSGSITRPDKYDVPADTLAGKFLEQRRGEYKDTTTAVMGRYFSSYPGAPEMTHKYDDKKMEKIDKALGHAKTAWEAQQKANPDYTKLVKGTPEHRAYYTARNDFINAIHTKQVGEYLRANRISREAQFTSDKAPKGKMDFYDGTSSVNGIIGAMTGNQSMLQNSRLHEGYKNADKSAQLQKYPHTETLNKIGAIGLKGEALAKYNKEPLGDSGAFKPYFANTLSGARGTLTADDFKGIGSKGSLSPKEVIKEAAKKLFTPGTYGSNVHGSTYEVRSGPNQGQQGVASGGAKNAVKILVESGMSHKLATETVSKMADNFKSSPLVNFNKGFRDLISHAPEGFVYENPMSGFQMSFDKYSRNKYKTEEVVRNGKLSTRQVLDKTSSGTAKSLSKSAEVTNSETGEKLRLTIPYVSAERSGRQTNSGAAALFVQNWDSAIISHLGTELKTPHTLHDAIAIKPKQEKDLHREVAKAYNTVAKLDPLGNLAKQMIAQIKHNYARIKVPSVKDRRAMERHVRAVQQSLLNLRNSTRNPGTPPYTSSDQHNLGSVNVKPENAHFEKE